MKPLITEASPVTVNRVAMFRLRYDDGSIRTEPPLTALAELRTSLQIAGMRADNIRQEQQKQEERIKEGIARGENPAPMRANLAKTHEDKEQNDDQRSRMAEMAAQVRAAMCQPYAKALREQMQAHLARTTAALPPLFSPTTKGNP